MTVSQQSQATTAAGNPLRLDKVNRDFYEALVQLHHTDFTEKDLWLAAYRRIQTIKKTQGSSILDGWRIYYVNYMPKGAIDVALAEKMFRRTL